MTLYTRHVNVFTDRGLNNGWSLQILVGWRKPPFNKGAGYIGGATFYLTYGAVNQGDMYRPRGLQMGFTRNASKVPWLRH